VTVTTNANFITRIQTKDKNMRRCSRCSVVHGWKRTASTVRNVFAISAARWGGKFASQSGMWFSSVSEDSKTIRSTYVQCFVDDIPILMDWFRPM